MRALDIDFLARSRPAGWVSWALLASGVLLFAAALDDHLAARAGLARLEARVARQKQPSLRHDKPVGQTPAAASAAVDPDAALRRLAVELAIPWDGMLEAVELAVDDRLALLSVAGDGKSRELRLEAEARSLADALAFAERLRDSLRFDEVALVFQEDRPVGSVTVVHFQLRAIWSAV